jgi:hypothetical protein
MNRGFEFLAGLVLSIALFGAPLSVLADEATAPTSPTVSPAASPKATGRPLKQLHRSIRSARPRIRMRKALIRKVTGATGAPKQVAPGSTAK